MPDLIPSERAQVLKTPANPQKRRRRRSFPLTDDDADLTDSLEVYFSTIRARKIARLSLSQTSLARSQEIHMPISPTPMHSSTMRSRRIVHSQGIDRARKAGFAQQTARNQKIAHQSRRPYGNPNAQDLQILDLSDEPDSPGPQLSYRQADTPRSEDTHLPDTADSPDSRRSREPASILRSEDEQMWQEPDSPDPSFSDEAADVTGYDNEQMSDASNSPGPESSHRRSSITRPNARGRYVPYSPATYSPSHPPVTQAISEFSAPILSTTQATLRRIEYSMRAVHPALINARRMRERRAKEKVRLRAEDPDEAGNETEPDVIVLSDSSDSSDDEAAPSTLVQWPKELPLISHNQPRTPKRKRDYSPDGSLAVTNNPQVSSLVPPTTAQYKPSQVVPSETASSDALAPSSLVTSSYTRRLSLSPTTDIESNPSAEIERESSYAGMAEDGLLHERSTEKRLDSDRTMGALSSALRDLDTFPVQGDTLVPKSGPAKVQAGLDVPLLNEQQTALKGPPGSVQFVNGVYAGTPVGSSINGWQVQSPQPMVDDLERIDDDIDSSDPAKEAGEHASLPTPISLDDDSMSTKRRGKSKVLPLAPYDESGIPLTMFGDPALADDEAVISNPFGIIQPQMRHRRNQYTNWSSRVGPGTALDLLPELDKYYDGGRYRWEMLWVEEVRVTGMNHIPEKQLFVMVAWNRWKYEKGPISLAHPHLAPYLIGWLDKYWPILRHAQVVKETRGHLTRLFDMSVINANQAIEALGHLDRLAKEDRRARGELDDDDLWEDEQERLRLGQ